MSKNNLSSSRLLYPDTRMNKLYLPRSTSLSSKASRNMCIGVPIRLMRVQFLITMSCIKASVIIAIKFPVKHKLQIMTKFFYKLTPYTQWAIHIHFVTVKFTIPLYLYQRLWNTTFDSLADSSSME